METLFGYAQNNAGNIPQLHEMGSPISPFTKVNVSRLGFGPWFRDYRIKVMPWRFNELPAKSTPEKRNMSPDWPILLLLLGCDDGATKGG